MRASIWAIWGVICSGLVACDPPPLADRGGECNSLSDCKPGLTCIEERCTDDVSTIVGMTPVFEGGAAPDGGS